jgi:glycopeptide antibiotics resistance protein
MVIVIRFHVMMLLVTIAWILFRFIIGIKNQKVSIKREIQLLAVYICIIFICRFVYFPLEHDIYGIAPLVFVKNLMFPPRINLIPFNFLTDVYPGWQINIIGNILMFVPVGIVWPICFKELDNIKKTVLAGFGFTLLIELSQLPFFDRCSDVDDLILNTTGAAIGAVIYFGIRRIKHAYTARRHRTT